MYLSIKYLYAFALIFMLAACDEPVEGQNSNMDSTDIGINYLALGDSYTIGQSVATDLTYPKQLEAKLRMEGIEWESTTIIAKTGWRTSQLQAAIETETLLEEYQLVSLLIGVNDQFWGESLDLYRSQFSELLSRAIELAAGNKERVFVLSIPDYAFTPFGQSGDPESISADIDVFNAANKEITEAAGVHYYDITDISRLGLEQPNLVASDKLHPSGEMYAEWVERILTAVFEQLN